MAAKPRVVIISGPSGVGKDTVARGLIAADPDKHSFVVTCTSRPPRTGEQDMRDYQFLPAAEFQAMIKADAFLEWSQVYDHYYGVPRRAIADILEAGKNAIIRADIQGIKKLSEVLPDALVIVLLTPSIKDLRERLKARSDASAEQQQYRLSIAHTEIKQFISLSQRHLVYNFGGQMDDAVSEIMRILKQANG